MKSLASSEPWQIAPLWKRSVVSQTRNVSEAVIVISSLYLVDAMSFGCMCSRMRWRMLAISIPIVRNVLVLVIVSELQEPTDRAVDHQVEFVGVQLLRRSRYRHVLGHRV